MFDLSLGGEIGFGFLKALPTVSSSVALSVALVGMLGSVAQ